MAFCVDSGGAGVVVNNKYTDLSWMLFAVVFIQKILRG